MKAIDLRSDTVTHPTEAMRRAMFEAEVGDDVYGEDPTVNALESKGAEMMGKEAGLLAASGTMANLLAVLSQTTRGDEIIVGGQSHIFCYEVGGAAVLGGVMVRTVPNEPNGQMRLEAIEAAIRGANIHFPPTSLLCLENTHNLCGGAVLSRDYTAAAIGLAHGRGLRVHIDGARIFNAAVALGMPAHLLAPDADSVSFCLSKGLSAPIGSVLCSSRDTINRARKWRKMLGGGMRQAGVIAAAGMVALKTMVSRLAEDHDNARRLARGLGRIPGLRVTGEPETNIVMFEVLPGIAGVEFSRRAESSGVKVGHRGGQLFRAVTHRMVTGADIDEAVERLSGCLRQ